MLEVFLKQGNYSTYQEAYQSIISTNVEVVDNTLYTWAGIALLVGPEATEAIRVALESNNLSWVVYQLGGNGIDLSHEQVQQVLFTFAAAGIPRCDILAAKGRSIQPIWKSWGLAVEPNLQEVEAAWTFLQPLPTDTIEKQILVSINANSQKTLVTATITELTMRDGEVIAQSKPEVLMNGTLIDLVTPVIEALRNG